MAILVKKVEILKSNKEVIRFQIYLYCFLNDLVFSKNEIECLSRFYLYGITDEVIKNLIRDNVYKNEQIIKNFLSRLKKLEIIEKVGKEKRLTKKLNIVVDDIILYNLKIGNK
jgi:uncharacterized protein YihD (DUF1040 family)